MTLQEQYEAETGKTPWDTIEGFSVYTDDYIEWLEEKINFNSSLTVK